MGGCANSKYAVDEDGKNKTSGGDVDKTKSKKPFLNIKNKLTLKNGTVKKEEGEVVKTAANGVGVGDESHKNGDVANKEEIEFIDTEKAAAAATTTTVKEEENEDGKKEVTTYQTTVVKHTQKEGDELLQHLRDEAFRTLQNSLKHLNANTTKTTTASAGESGQAQTTVEDGESSSAQQSAEELIGQVKAQVVVALGRVKQDEIGSIVDAGVELIRESRVKSMAELESELEKKFEDAELVKKVVNATTGFLTAKGTEAGALLSNILANVSNGIQGVMNETEKTTVKVTRTITEHVLSGGQIKEVTRVITEPMMMSSADASNPPPATLTDILKNLTSDKQVKQGSQVTHSSVQESEEHETVTSNIELKEKAEKVVSQAVEAAVEKLADETTDSAGQPNGFHHDESIQEEKIKVEEESTVKTSTTKIILNGTDEHLSAVQAEFFKTGKQEAENVVKKLEEAAAAVADEIEEVAAEGGAATEESETKTANTNENTKTELTG